MAVGSVDQCLQQFVNQSPWRWEPVRQALARRATPIRPQAWVVQEVVFPKNGASSVGVARQYASSAGRVLNCQLGLAVLLASQDAACALNWRLMLPYSWNDDPRRRARTRLPDQERHRPRWQHIFESVDEMTSGWGLRPAPVVLDACAGEAQQIMHGLTARGLPYVVKVPGHTPVLQTAAYRRVLTADQLAARSVKRVILPGQGRSGSRAAVVQYSVAAVCESCLTTGAAQATTRCPHARTRRVLAQWAPGGQRLSAVWLTNLTTACPHELVNLITMSMRARTEVVPTLRNEFGLQDFEGRSFAGWHHHVTLVSAAHTLSTLRRIRKQHRTDALGTDAIRRITTRVSTVDDRALQLRQA
jgi:SRSO17 transposase